jgi:hypothetical protein
VNSGPICLEEHLQGTIAAARRADPAPEARPEVAGVPGLTPAWCVEPSIMSLKNRAILRGYP